MRVVFLKFLFINRRIEMELLIDLQSEILDHNIRTFAKRTE